MTVRFPSGETKNYPHAFSVVQGIIAAQMGVDVGQQLYFLDSKLMKEKKKIPKESMLDLCILVENKYGVCSAHLQKELERIGVIPLVTPESLVSSRDPKELDKQLRFYKNLDLYHQNKDLKESQLKIVEPFFNSFASKRDFRHENIQKICGRFKCKTFVTSTFNEPYSDLFENFITSCEYANIKIREKLIIFPMDEAAEKKCKELGVTSFYSENSYGPTTSKRNNYGDRDFSISMFMKIAVVKDLLDLGHDVLFTDMDMVWLKDPIPYLEKLSSLHLYDFMFMNDGVNARFQPLYYNSGFFHIRNTVFSVKTWNKLFDNYDKVFTYRSQQEPLNIILNNYRNRGLRTFRLDESLFVNGHLFTPNKKYSLSDETYVVHASWTGNIKEKLRNLKSMDLWYLE
jgi:hypothetical protein